MGDKQFAKILIFVIAALVAVFAAYSYYSPSAGAAPLDDSKATKEGIHEVAEGNNEFALDLYKNLTNTDGNKNIFFSPWSISTALSMAYEGARGQTAEEMQSVLHVPKNDMVRRSSFARLYNLMNINKKYELSLANALWAQEDYPILDSYKDVNRNYYGAEVDNLDFSGDPKGSADRINRWVEEETRGKIDELVKGNTLPNIRLVLTNAIYFKGDWVKQFDETKTRDEEFKISPDRTVKAPMMRHDENKDFNYTETENLKTLKLPYKGKDLSMLILLPKEEFGLTEIEKNLTADMLYDIESDLSTQEVNVVMPKFEFKTDYNLKGVLEEMGMVRPFGNADFSGITGDKSLFIEFVKHKAYIKVNEKGTEAAAATAVGMAESAARYNTFHADHPFIFMIKDDRTDSILFMGKVVDPTK